MKWQLYPEMQGFQEYAYKSRKKLQWLAEIKRLQEYAYNVRKQYRTKFQVKYKTVVHTRSVQFCFILISHELGFLCYSMTNKEKHTSLKNL